MSEGIWKIGGKIQREKETETLGGKPVPEPISPPQIPHSLTLNLTWSFTVINRRLTVWTTARS